jgi:hypothetical protein
VVTDPKAGAESARISLVREARWMLMTVLGANDPPSGARAAQGKAPSAEVGGPSSGHFVDLLVYETPQALFARDEPLARVHWVWGEDAPAEELDEESYRQRAGDPRSGDVRPQAFYDLFHLAPEGNGHWQLAHAYGGLFRGRRMFNGVRHWLVRHGDVVAVEDTDLWFS